MTAKLVLVVALVTMFAVGAAPVAAAEQPLPPEYCIVIAPDHSPPVYVDLDNCDLPVMLLP